MLAEPAHACSPKLPRAAGCHDADSASCLQSQHAGGSACWLPTSTDMPSLNASAARNLLHVRSRGAPVISAASLKALTSPAASWPVMASTTSSVSRRLDRRLHLPQLAHHARIDLHAATAECSELALGLRMGDSLQSVPQTQCQHERMTCERCAPCASAPQSPAQLGAVVQTGCARRYKVDHSAIPVNTPSFNWPTTRELYGVAWHTAETECTLGTPPTCRRPAVSTMTASYPSARALARPSARCRPACRS